MLLSSGPTDKNWVPGSWVWMDNTEGVPFPKCHCQWWWVHCCAYTMFTLVVILRLSLLVMICGELVSVYAVRSTVFVLRRNVQLVHPEVCVRWQFLFRFCELDGNNCSNVYQYFLVDISTCAYWFAWPSILHDLRSASAFLGWDLLSG